MIYLSAGHNPKGTKVDPGAVGNGFHEANLTVELRDLTVARIKALGGSVTTDQDTETLGQYVGRIKPGSGSVVCEFHFNAATPQATGAETIVKKNASKEELALAKEVNDAIVTTLGLRDRGVIDESKSQHKRLAILNTGAGMSILPEIAFISNAEDVKKYKANKEALANKIAAILIKYDNLKS